MVILWYSLNNFDICIIIWIVLQSTMVLPFDNITLPWYHTLSEFVLHYFNQNIWF